jgi:hypothetical protein
MKNHFHVGPYEKVKDRPFTDLQHSVEDLTRLISMARQLVDSYDDPELCDYSKSRSAISQSDPQGNDFKIYYIRPKKLFSAKKLSVVGFFGYRRSDADIEPIIRADKKLEKIYLDFEGLLSLSTIQLPSGDFANLVIFTDDEVKDQWNFNPTHFDTVSKISPSYYTSIRINNGILPKGVDSPELLRLTKVRYFDYTVSPHWQAVRKIESLPK